MALELTVIGECSGAPLAGGATSCYLVESKNTSLVLDLGSGALSKLMAVTDFDRINDIIISHFHADHMADAAVAVYSRLISRDLGKPVSPIRFHALEDHGLTSEVSTVHIVDENSKEMIGDMRIEYLRTTHSVPCLAVRIECEGKRLVYTADGALTEELIAFAASSDILISECSLYPEMRLSGHMNAVECAELAISAKPRIFVISHLPIYGERERILDYVREKYNGEVYLASPLLHIEV